MVNVVNSFYNTYTHTRTPFNNIKIQNKNKIKYMYRCTEYQFQASFRMWISYWLPFKITCFFIVETFQMWIEFWLTVQNETKTKPKPIYKNSNRYLKFIWWTVHMIVILCILMLMCLFSLKVVTFLILFLKLNLTKFCNTVILFPNTVNLLRCSEYQNLANLFFLPPRSPEYWSWLQM